MAFYFIFDNSTNTVERWQHKTRFERPLSDRFSVEIAANQTNRRILNQKYDWYYSNEFKFAVWFLYVD